MSTEIHAISTGAVPNAASHDWQGLPTDELVAHLKHEDGWPEPALLHEILTRGEAAVPALAAFVQQMKKDEPYEPAYYYAVELLILLRDPSALPAIAHFYRNSDDDTAESMSMSLPAFGPALIPHLLPFVGDRSLTWYQRAMAGEILQDVAGNDPALRQQLAEAFRAALADYVAEANTLPTLSPERAQDFTDNVSSLVVALRQVGTDEDRTLVRAAFDADLVDRFIADDDILDEPFGDHDQGPFTPSKWMDWYENAYAHRNDPPPAPPSAPSFSRSERESLSPPQPYIAPKDKPGRNDPCWCGSGKKYKKCHLGKPDDRFRGT